jgi:pyruvate dehydrogenase E1 component beta subunit
VPGIKIVMPSNPSDAKGLLKSAIRDNYPVLFLEHHDLYKTEGDVPEEEYLTPIGEAKVVKEGDDVTVITYGYVVFEALKAGEALAKKGINIEIIDLRTVKPFDEETVFKSIKKTGRAVIFHEARKTGGLGGEISACISEKAFDSLKAPVIRIGAADVPSNFPPTSKGLMERIGALFAK